MVQSTGLHRTQAFCVPSNTYHQHCPGLDINTSITSIKVDLGPLGGYDGIRPMSDLRIHESNNKMLLTSTMVELHLPTAFTALEEGH